MDYFMKAFWSVFVISFPAYTTGGFIFLVLDSLNQLISKIWLSLLIGFVCGTLTAIFGIFGDLFLFITFLLVYLYQNRQSPSPYRPHQLAWGIAVFNLISLQTTLSSSVSTTFTPKNGIFFTAVFSIILSSIIIFLYMRQYTEINQLVLKLDPTSSYTRSLTAFTIAAFLSLLVIEMYNELFTSNPSIHLWILDSVTILLDIACLFLTISSTHAAESIEQSQAVIASQRATAVFSAKAKQTQAETNRLLHDYKNIIQSLQNTYHNGATGLDQELNDAQLELSKPNTPKFNLNGIDPGLVTGLLITEWMKAEKNGTDLSVKVEPRSLAFNHALQLDLSRILGILIDNAIDAVRSMPSKDVGLSIYVEPNGDATINVRNQVSTSFKLSHLIKPDFTTKGDGHGHGWGNIRELTAANPSLQCLPQLNSDILTVKVIVSHEEVTYDK